eukprot:TRINITY_DN94361_c0_g1_i1.p1 TRINITY_DN94361_c0_g1~~TRINITY_DN94361_c0_g1_i1.p1  ORF type:complete len:103 (-),score=21.54 TRINITY_DN94361_c0_g1_i1:185-493(-)
MFLSPVLLRSKSRRLAVQLVSSAQTGYQYWTEKSPLKKDTRLALRKYDAVVDRYVMFYETPITRTVRRVARPRPMAWARWTGTQIQELVKVVKKKHEKKGYF